MVSFKEEYEDENTISDLSPLILTEPTLKPEPLIILEPAIREPEPVLGPPVFDINSSSQSEPRNCFNGTKEDCAGNFICEASNHPNASSHCCVCE